jgi:enamine deaminase RidA (YjgF/YER057c/UK114 family)
MLLRASVSKKESEGIMYQRSKEDAGNHINRRTALVAGLASASIISSTSVFAQQAAAGSVDARLRQLGIELPKVAAPVANYVPAARLGNLVFLAGTGPRNPDGTRPQGKVGLDVTLDQANQHARNVGLQLLAALREETGNLDKVIRIGRVFGMVNAASDFTDHPKVINGCSDLFVEVFGDRGRHARCAVGMGSLPFNMTVEIEAVVEVA